MILNEVEVQSLEHLNQMMNDLTLDEESKAALLIIWQQENS